MKEGCRFAYAAFGKQCVIVSGIIMVQELYAHNSDIREMVGVCIVHVAHIDYHNYF